MNLQSPQKINNQNNQHKINNIETHQSKTNNTIYMISAAISCILILSFFLGLNYYQYLKMQQHIQNQKQIRRSEGVDKIINFELQKSLAIRNKRIVQLQLQINTFAQLKKQSIKQLNFYNSVKKADLKSKTFQFAIPKIIYVYHDENKILEYKQKIYIQNIRFYSYESGFKIHFIRQDNFDQWLQKKTAKQLQQILLQIPLFNKNIKLQEQMKEQMIMLYFLRELGGIVIKKPYILIQNIKWLQNFKDIKVANIGNKQTVPNVFGFFTSKNSLKSQRLNLKKQFQAQKYIVNYPGLMNIFLAANPHTEFIADLCQEFRQIIMKFDKFDNIVQKNKHIAKNIDIYDINSAFTLASIIVLAKKQSQLNQIKIQFQKLFLSYPYSIDYYGLFTIDASYFPDKIQHYFKNTNKSIDVCFNFLGQITQKQLQEYIGPLRYIANPNISDQLYNQIKMIKNNTSKIAKESFIHRHLFLNYNLSYISNDQHTLSTTKIQELEQLSKTIWIVMNNSYQHLTVIQQLSYLNIQEYSNKAGFKLNIVNEKNINSFLSNQDIQKIEEKFKSTSILSNIQFKLDIIRLSLLVKYGGIHLNPSYFFMEDLNWIAKIYILNTKYFASKFRQISDVEMLIDHIFETADYNKDIIYKKKGTIYENNLLVSNQENLFIKDWYNSFLLYQVISSRNKYYKIKQCIIKDFTKTKKQNKQLTAMDFAKNVRNCKENIKYQNKINSNEINSAENYYKFWAIYDFNRIQQQIFSNDDNSQLFQINDKNTLIYRVSQAYIEQIYGDLKFIKFDQANLLRLNNFLVSNAANNFIFEVHPQSIFSKYIFNRQNRQFFEDSNGRLQVRRLK